MAVVTTERSFGLGLVVTMVKDAALRSVKQRDDGGDNDADDDDDDYDVAPAA